MASNYEKNTFIVNFILVILILIFVIALSYIGKWSINYFGVASWSGYLVLGNIACAALWGDISATSATIKNSAMFAGFIKCVLRGANIGVVATPLLGGIMGKIAGRDFLHSAGLNLVSERRICVGASIGILTGILVGICKYFL